MKIMLICKIMENIGEDENTDLQLACLSRGHRSQLGLELGAT
jgi:hypothetical protein